ncbi:tetratricopeptide repeat protein [Yunchengibacter salinarum]|uniref:tetratricopeptide repeat protein n=1 Tax=Yunchengibacter salinarum TaxID=3133399 RepID=UPI0035B5C408
MSHIRFASALAMPFALALLVAPVAQQGFSAPVQASALMAQAQVAPKYRDISRDLVKQGETALEAAEGQDEAKKARALFEQALVANPANVSALMGLGRSYEALEQLGRALKYYRHALELAPNNREALKRQALVFLQRDLPERARHNRDRLSRLCDSACAPLTAVEEALMVHASDTAAKNQKTDDGR